MRLNRENMVAAVCVGTVAMPTVAYYLYCAREGGWVCAVMSRLSELAHWCGDGTEQGGGGGSGARAEASDKADGTAGWPCDLFLPGGG